jgi:hypothetical protein
MDIKSILFLDIETIPEYKTLEEAPERIKNAWLKKHQRSKAMIEKHGDTGGFAGANASYLGEAALYPEFGKICCISIGLFTEEDEGGTRVTKFKLKSLYGKNEKALLEEFCSIMGNQAMLKYQICAHNGKQFDFPYISRRCLINNTQIPIKFQVWGKKPWELTQFLDTMDLWKFGSFKGTSLDEITMSLGIESPKGDMDGSMVAEVYHNGQWKRLTDYCEGDVLATARSLQRMHLWTPVIDSMVMSDTKFDSEKK